MRALDRPWLLKVGGPVVALAISASCSSVGDRASTRKDLVLASQSEGLSQTAVTQGADELRSAWYSDEPALSPGSVGGGAFGQIFSTAVTGEVYGQPLVWANTLLVTTQANQVYGLDPASGAIRWSRNFGVPFETADVGCSNVDATMGVMGTPVIDQATNIAYMIAKNYVNGASGATAFYAHALALASGQEQPGFPVLIAGSASNDPTQVFHPTAEGQRTGLLLLDGVVYAGFGSMCDISPWSGWIVGVSETGTLTTMWSTETGPGKVDGAGIWMSGDGLLSDGPGQIIFATGNDGSAQGPVIPGTTPPATLGESVVRLGVQSDGSLKATDFFEPYDAPSLDGWDADLGSGGPIGLPPAYFGTAQYPNLLVQIGKEGYVYLLDGNHLGGMGNGPGAGDAAVGRIGPYGGVWSKPAVWPGDGGYVFVPSATPTNSPGPTGTAGLLNVFKYGLDGTGKPTLSLAAQSSDAFGFSSSSPIVTSNGIQSGSALVWVVWLPDFGGNGAQLRAYDAVPVNGQPFLRYSAPVGQGSKFVPPGVSGGRVYVGTRDGHVLGFGGATAPSLSGSGFNFGNVLEGTSASTVLTVTATNVVTVTSVSSSSGDFVLGTTMPGLPVTLQTGGTLQIPVRFIPSSAGVEGASVSIATNTGGVSLMLSGMGVSPAASLSAAPSMLSFGGVNPSGQIVGTVTFTNVGGTSLSITAVDNPSSPFSLSGSPPVGDTLTTGQNITVSVTFAPTVLGTYTGSFGLETTAGTVKVQLSGNCTPPGHLVISSTSVPFGSVGLGATVLANFTLTNNGGSPITFLKSKPPALGPFLAQTSLPEGSSLGAGASVTETVAFTPTQLGTVSDMWFLNAADGTGLQTVTFTGTGATDITASGTPIAFITNPQGGGSHNLGVIDDGVYPPVGSTNSLQQYDTWTGQTRTEDWIGYQFTAPVQFGGLVFQDGKQFADGGWFQTLNVQVRQNGVWISAPGLVAIPPYAGNDGVNFQTYSLTFPSITGDAIRLDGAPGGSATFISVGELRVLQAAATPGAPIASAGANQTVAPGAVVTLDGTGSTDPNGAALTYSWNQTGGPTVSLSSATASKPTFTAPAATASVTLVFSLVVQDSTFSSTPSTVTVTVTPPAPPPPPTPPDLTAKGTPIALITSPTGGGNHNIQVIADDVFAPVGSTNNLLEYDTYNGQTRTEDWIGYQFTSQQTFGSLVFQDGKQFADGGWFTTLNVQVLQNGTWVNVPGTTVSPAYAGNNGINFQTYTFSFPAIAGNGIRIDGKPGGASTFISVGELRPYGALGPPGAPTANAGTTQTVTQGALVTLDGTGSTDPNGAALTYSWTQTAGPTVTLSSPTAAKPTFTAPSVTASTNFIFGLVVQNSTLSSTPSAVTVTVNPPAAPPPPTPADLTPSGTPIALITSPLGGGNHNIAVIADDVFPPVGSTNSLLEYDTWTGQTRAEDWIGYQFAAQQTFGSLVFQDGMQFADGGWFTTLNVQVLQNGSWVNVPGSTVSPAYAGNNGINFQTYTFSFPTITGNGIRIDGRPGGSATFISVGELRVYGALGPPGAPTANAGASQTATQGALVTLDGTGSTDPNGATLTYSWTQTGGPAVTLSSPTAAKPTFTAPAVTTSTNLVFGLVVQDATFSSTPSSVTVTVNPSAAPPPPTPPDLTAGGTPIALITNPTGGGNHNIAVIADDVFAPLGSTDSSLEYDTYNGQTRTEDWIGYQFSSQQTFGSLVFQDGKQFADGGWFATLNVQVRQNGTWVNVPGTTASPAYAGDDGINFQTYTFSFPAITGDGIRLDGQPGGASTFISVGELRVYGALGPPGAPTANAGANQSVIEGALVTLDASGSTDPNGAGLTYSWTQTGGPRVTLSSTTAAKPTFTAPSVTASTNFVFSLVVQNATLSSTPSAVTVTVSLPPPPTPPDLTANGTPIALITNPTGGGNHNIAVIADGVFAPLGSTNSLLEYDTYNGQTRTEDWIGYQFATPQTFGSLVFQDGKQFADGGWFTTLNVQVLQNGTWVNVPGTTASPAYAGNDGIYFQTYTFSFPAITGNGIRIDGKPGGSATFISVGELRAYGVP